jgi:hypothetical protein
MSHLFAKNSWLVGALIFLMPVLLIFFLGSQMAYSQVKGKFEAYQGITELARLSELADLPAGRVVMLRGRIKALFSKNSPVKESHDLIVFQERPAAGREARYQEEFRLIFPEFGLELADGVVTVRPSLSREPVIQHERHAVSEGDRAYTGFRAGDTVTVQGRWQPGGSPTLDDATGVTGTGRAGLMREWQAAFQKVAWVRNGLGLLSLLGLALLLVQLRRARNDPLPADNAPSGYGVSSGVLSTDQSQEEEAWPPQKTQSVPTISP